MTAELCTFYQTKVTVKIKQILQEIPELVADAIVFAIVFQVRFRIPWHKQSSLIGKNRKVIVFITIVSTPSLTQIQRLSEAIWSTPMDFSFKTHQAQKLRPQRVLVKTTWTSDCFWSIIFRVIAFIIYLEHACLIDRQSQLKI